MVFMNDSICPLYSGDRGGDQLGLASCGFQDIGKFSEEERVAVMDDVLHSIQLPIEGIGLIAGNLRRPVRIRIAGDAAQPDFAGGDIFKEEDGLTDEPVGCQKLVRREVAGSQDILVGIEELAPVAVFVAVFGRVDAVIGENPLDGHEADLMAEVFDVIGDPLVAPVGIVIADFHYQRDGFLIEHPASAFLLSRPRAVVLFRNQLLIPVHQSIRRPGGFRDLQEMGIECSGLAGKALAVGVSEFRPFLSSRFLVLFLVDAELSAWYSMAAWRFSTISRVSPSRILPIKALSSV